MDIIRYLLTHLYKWCQLDHLQQVGKWSEYVK